MSREIRLIRMLSILPVRGDRNTKPKLWGRTAVRPY